MTIAKLQLPQVTLIALTGLNYKTKEHIEAIEKSCEGIDFGAVKLIQLGSITDINSWNKAVIYDLPTYIESPFCLFIHHDGFVINPSCWNYDWLNYDYIGAPWPLPVDDYSYRDKNGQVQRVGNSVSLRSKRLLDLANKSNLEWRGFHGFTNEDGFICVNYRHFYEEAGMKFAPLEVAKYFSKEHEIEKNKDIKTFAFHQV
mgnify:CR=1 FL=1